MEVGSVQLRTLRRGVADQKPGATNEVVHRKGLEVGSLAKTDTPNFKR